MLFTAFSVMAYIAVSFLPDWVFFVELPNAVLKADAIVIFRLSEPLMLCSSSALRLSDIISKIFMVKTATAVVSTSSSMLNSVTNYFDHLSNLTSLNS